MGQLDPAIEQQLANLSDAEWSALSARVRAPDGVEGLRAAASQHLSGAALDSFVRCADVAAFAADDGRIDAGKVTQYIAALYGTSQTQTGQSEWGRRGESGRDAATRRHGQKTDPETEPAAPDHGTPGAAGRAAAEQRHPSTGKD
ncbi:hypothetical protein GBO17_14235 [Mycobacterium avium subsp. hominissuis]|uniref:hypothetical protein n=1 Tax=Mycobacterium avium TaxID=1764 RepID=UPI001CC45DC3|nr:hypothetical protein [Mycobacterium avium]MBZ4558586.1 hypothetical protein [Mycobacterium avium subsp. hominissuis]MBZ4569621.1 hypothetical protein [Mycobacterium avium subsp. hominissuis]MBZ4587941.1 hypothetical protein [Mycobacterium avium subsp. hominissuis]MBZ4625448.1 hypothetical protein [Mycobacterium avium subsp. hominissuis]